MNNNIIPKISDIKSLQDLSKVFALPMLSVAYILQTGLAWSWDGKVFFEISNDMPANVQLVRYVVIVIIKSTWISFWGALFYGFIAIVDTYLQDLFLPATAIVLFTFGLLGLFDLNGLSCFKQTNHFWFYACFVWGFFFLDMSDKGKNRGVMA